MKYQLNVFLHLLKKKYFKLSLVFVLFFSCMILITYINPVEVDLEVFKPLVGVISLENFSFVDYLWFMFQLFFTIYLSYVFFSYEENNSKEFLVLRKNYLYFMLSKLVLFLIFIIIFRLLIFFIPYLIFKETVKFSFITLICSIGIYIAISIFTYLFYII